MNTYTHHLADRIAANHHDDLIRSAAQRELAAGIGTVSTRRRIALSMFSTRRRRFVSAASLGLSTALAVGALAVAAPTSVETPPVEAPIVQHHSLDFPYSDSVVFGRYLRAV
jgi:hypothetical protein